MGWPWPTGTPDFKTSFTWFWGLWHFSESFHFLWPQLWSINCCENLGAPACEVFILSSVMGCLCSGPAHRLWTRKCTLPCQEDMAEQEGKMWCGQAPQAPWRRRLQTSCLEWHSPPPLPECSQEAQQPQGQLKKREMAMVCSAVLQGPNRVVSSQGGGLCPPALGTAAPGPLPTCSSGTVPTCAHGSRRIPMARNPPACWPVCCSLWMF